MIVATARTEVKPVSKASRKTRSGYAHPTLGFGVPATTDPHHFIVHIPRGNQAPVLISESLGTSAESFGGQVLDRVLLERPRWTSIRSEVQRAFNARLKERNLAAGTWKAGDTPVDRLLGKELCVLAWAIEHLERDKIHLAVRNWLALRPEERWWLFGMTAMSTGGLNDSGQGWRLALRHALGDVAQTEILKARRVKAKPDSEDSRMLNLFDFE